MKKRIMSLLLALLMVVGIVPFPAYATEEQEDNCPYCEETMAEDGSVIHTDMCTAAYAYDGTADIGKYAIFSDFSVDYGVVVSGDPVTEEGMIFYYDEFGADSIFSITDWYWDSEITALWYAVELYRGAFPESNEDVTWPETPWIMQNYTQDWAEDEDALTFLTLCPVCGKPDCTTEHIQCEICGAYDCHTTHIYCQLCENYDCGQEHLFCLACEKYDCTLTHTFCGYCNDYDCGIDHLEMNKPAATPVLPDAPALTEGAEVSIVDEAGDAVTEEGVFLVPGMRSSLSAWSSMENASYQWQICYDPANDLWTNIQGQTGKGILISPAMFLSIIEEQGTAAIRCVTTAGEETKISDAIPVSIIDPISQRSFAFASNSMPLAETENPDELGKSYVVVQYQYADGRTAAASDFAQLVPGTAYNHSYKLPSIPGYKAGLKTHSFGESVKIEGDNLAVDLAEGVLTEDYTIFTVIYEPDYVDFTVIHYWQNVTDDYYTEHARKTISNEYKTGEVITEAHKIYPGFYNLLYETPTAAADGSTVIEVYYDRYYYLMTFDQGENGYGVDPIYARYGDELNIGTPTRAGYTFLGWKLNDEGNTIASADMPTSMPAENRKYVAQWKAAEKAKVSVVIWGENPDDEKYSYQKTIEIDAKPGETIRWDTLKYDCGYTAHTHSADCGYNCGLEEHAHSLEKNCYTLTCTQESHNHDDCTLTCNHTTHELDCYQTRDWYTLKETTKPNGIESENFRDGSIYTYGSGYSTHYYLYLGGKWYCYYGNISGTKYDTQSISLECAHSHDDSCYDCGKTATTHNHTVAGGCYSQTCDLTAHTHSETCGYKCGLTAHTHTAGCEVDTEVMDTDLWTFVKSDTVTVNADGTTVMNVYYDRKTFTLTFHYSYSKNSYSKTSTITDKWGADIGTRFLSVNTDANGNLWSTSTGGGSPWTSYLQIMPQYNEDYYCRNSSTNEQTAEYYTENPDGTYSLEYSVTAYYGSNLTISKEDFYEMEGFTYYEGTDGDGKSMPSPGSYGDFDGAVFKYKRHKYALEFYNPTTLLRKRTGIYYESGLGGYDFTPTSEEAPTIYEPGTVRFAGWYLNPECTGEQYILADHTMPSATQDGLTALVLYAKWEPVEYKVNYYLTRESLDRDETIPAEMARLVAEAVAAGMKEPSTDPYTTVFAEAIVKHGGYILNLPDPEVSEGYENIHPRAGYDFVGWFYLNEEGEETAFDPENMPVDRNLNLYAKWSANKLCQYNVYFALDADMDGKPDKDTDGNIIYIAEPVSGSGIAGRTYTFSAKGREELDSGYREGYFPTVGSHSLVIDISDEQGTDANSYIFLYQEKQAVPYTVRYVDKDTGETLFDDKVVSDNKHVVVTENFQYKQGYMPDDYQKTLVVTADGENVITFYYTKDEQHALYVVNYYIQDLNTDLTHKGWSKYTSLQNTGVIGTAYTAEAITIDGFKLSADYTDQYNDTKKINGMTGAALPTLPISKLTDGKLSGTLSGKGMELNFYYTRNLYPYEFRYMLNGTTTKLASTEVGMAGYDAIVTGAAKEIVMDLDGDGINEDYRLYDPTETTKDIHIIRDGEPLSPDAVVSEGQAKVNVATFYYVRCTQTMTITKDVVGNSSESDPDPNQEFAFRLLIHEKNGYHRNSYDFTKTDGTTGTLSPEVGAPNTLQFTLKAGQTITIEGLPTAEYTLTELNVPVGYYASYNITQENGRYKLTVDDPVNAVVTNTYEPANLTITKTVDVVEEDANIPEVEDFEFTIEVPEGVTGNYAYTIGDNTHSATIAEGKMTIELKDGQSATFLNLPVGSYTVSETDYSAFGYDSNYSVNDAEYAEGRIVAVTLTKGMTQAVEFMNKYPVGDLSIEKIVMKEFYGTAWDGDTFTFVVERTTEGRPLIAGNRYKVVMDGVELNNSAVVGTDRTLTVTIPFDEADAAQLTSADSSVMHTLVVKNLPAGVYTVKESVEQDYMQTPESLTVSNLNIPAETVTASFTNTVKRGNGDLYLEKKMEVLTGYEPPKDVVKFCFTIELLEAVPGEDQTFTVVYSGDTYTDGTKADTSVTMSGGSLTVMLEKDQNVTIKDLPEGKYRITEATVPYYANAFAHKENGNWIVQPGRATMDDRMYTEIAVKPEATAEVQCTNTYPVNRAELIIQKLVTKEYERDTLPGGSFTFTVTLTESDTDSYAYKVYNANGFVKDAVAAVTNNTFTIALEAGEYAVIPGMPVCSYSVSEAVSTIDYDTSYKVYVSETGDTASTTVNTGTESASGTGGSASRTFAAGKTDAVVFTNEYKRHLGTLTIRKIVMGTTEQDTFIFHIEGTSENNKHISMDVPITGSGSVTVFDLPLGSYTATENMDWSWRYTNNNPVQRVDLADDPDAELTFTNIYRESRWLNDVATMPNTFGKKEDE